MKLDTIRNWVVLCGFTLLIIFVINVNFCLAEEWKRVGERCIQNCNDQPVRSQNTREQTSQGQVKVQEKVTVRRNVDGQKSEWKVPVKH